MIDKDMKVMDILDRFPQTEEAFREYDSVVGKCILCHNLFDTLEEVSLIYEIDLDELIERIQRALY
jgi:hypothetical protein